MGFKAEEFVEPLDYDFNPFIDVKGTLPEPSDRAVNTFLKKWNRIVQGIVRAGIWEVEKIKPKTEEELDAMPEDERAAYEAKQQEIEDALPKTISDAVDAMATLSVDDTNGLSDAAKVANAMCELVEELSGGALTAQTLLQVPMRPRGVFFGWLIGELTDAGKGKAESSTILRAV